MSSTVCPGLGSCFEPCFIEPRTLCPKLTPPPNSQFYQSLSSWALSPFLSDSDAEKRLENSHNLENNNKSSNDGLGGSWSFIKALTGTTNEANNEQSLYVHPHVKSSFSKPLSEKSLELCTESLGSETGTDISENTKFSSSSSSSVSESGSKSLTKFRQQSWSEKVKCRNFPPPLTSISSSNVVHVRPHREGGRLVIKAVSVPPPQTCFHVERSDGRLRLRFLNPSFDSEASEEEEKERINHEEQEEEDDDDEYEYEESENEELDEDEDEEDEEEEEKESDTYLDEEIDGYDGNGEGEMGIENFQRPSRCKEDGHRGRNKGGLIWEPLWVATS